VSVGAWASASCIDKRDLVCDFQTQVCSPPSMPILRKITLDILRRSVQAFMKLARRLGASILWIIFTPQRRPYGSSATSAPLSPPKSNVCDPPVVHDSLYDLTGLPAASDKKKLHPPHLVNEGTERLLCKSRPMSSSSFKSHNSLGQRFFEAPLFDSGRKPLKVECFEYKSPPPATETNPESICAQKDGSVYLTQRVNLITIMRNVGL